MVIFQDVPSGLYWDGKQFAAEIKEKALPYPHEEEKAMLHKLPSQHVTIHGYVSSKNLAAEAKTGMEVTQAKKLQKLAADVVKSLASAGEKYLSLCRYIRENEVPQKLVSFELAAMGFTRQTIHKINKVSNAPAAEWNMYEARTIGFNRVLQLTSGNVQEAIAREAGVDVVDVHAEIERIDGPAESSGNGPAAAPDADTLKADWEKKLLSSATVILRAAAGLQLRGKTINGNNGYALTIKRVPLKKGKGASHEIAKGKDPKN